MAEIFEKVPDLIISDVMLPGMSGKVITQNLKTDIRTSHIPVILLTAQASVEQQIDGIDGMADVYMVKPFNYDQLLATVKNLIKNRGCKWVGVLHITFKEEQCDNKANHRSDGEMERIAPP